MKAQQLELNLKIPPQPRIKQRPLVEMPVKKKLDAKIKYVIFDFGGVLVKEGLATARRLYKEKSGVNIEQIWYNDIKPTWRALEKGEVADMDFWKEMERVVKEKDPRFDVNEFKEVMLKNQKYNKKIVGLIKRLRKKGYVTALLTNNVKEWLEEWDKKDPLNRYFDIVVSSHEVREIKPYPKIYQITLEKLGARPEECVFIDDKDRNIDTAIKLGMKGIVFETEKQVIKELNCMLENKLFRKRAKKRFKVICIDWFHDQPGDEDGAPIVVGRYRTAKEAVAAAREMTQDAMQYASHASVATVYYAHDDKGRYLGGDTWNGE